MESKVGFFGGLTQVVSFLSFFVATRFPLPETHSQLAAENIGALGKVPWPFLGRFKHFIFCRVAICFFLILRV